ncbi:hypothetical protein TWF102_002431 [Orbilia oligospora]|uniref:PH domain-containing protein n=1 Tax=Orbilia oligospora TaxID=2813651 RepID=A0A7C8N6V1_ORBOL|nr:hypothetical protein TWF102_002431 [Orbilia oligospora]
MYLSTSLILDAKNPKKKRENWIDHLSLYTEGEALVSSTMSGGKKAAFTLVFLVSHSPGATNFDDKVDPMKELGHINWAMGLDDSPYKTPALKEGIKFAIIFY